MIGAADALRETAGALRRADVDDEIDRAPVDAEIERRGAHDRAQKSLRHSAFHAPALARVQRAVVQRIGRLSSLMRQSCWKIASACARVLTNTARSWRS